jgi:hypothetical protein
MFAAADCTGFLITTGFGYLISPHPISNAKLLSLEFRVMGSEVFADEISDFMV